MTESNSPRWLDELISDEFVEKHIRELPWSADASDLHRTLVAGNIRNFANRLREHVLTRTSDASTTLIGVAELRGYARSWSLDDSEVYEIVTRAANALDAKDTRLARVQAALKNVAYERVLCGSCGRTYLWCKVCGGEDLARDPARARPGGCNHVGEPAPQHVRMAYGKPCPCEGA